MERDNMSNPPPPSSRGTRSEIALRQFQETLKEVAGRQEQLSLSDDLETILPVEERRSIWREMQSAGFELPELQLPAGVFWIAAVMILAPLVLLALALRTWFVFLSLGELGFLGYKLTRPLAIHPPDWCRTVGQAVLCRRNICRSDGRPVPWTREEVAERVRMIISECSGVRIEKITDDTPLIDLLGC